MLCVLCSRCPKHPQTLESSVSIRCGSWRESRRARRGGSMEWRGGGIPFRFLGGRGIQRLHNVNRGANSLQRSRCYCSSRFIGCCASLQKQHRKQNHPGECFQFMSHACPFQKPPFVIRAMWLNYTINLFTNKRTQQPHSQ